MTQRGALSRRARAKASSSTLTKWMNPAAVSHVLINMESRFTSLMELLHKRDNKQNPQVTKEAPVCAICQSDRKLTSNTPGHL